MDTILIIEDNFEIRTNIAELLAMEKYLVNSVTSGEQAFALWQKKVPDLIICDVRLKGIDGYQVYQSAQNISSLAAIPFIFVSAISEGKDRQRAKDLGITNYLVKPFDPDDLLACIKKCLTKLKKRNTY